MAISLKCMHAWLVLQQQYFSEYISEHFDIIEFHIYCVYECVHHRAGHSYNVNISTACMKMIIYIHGG